MKSNFCDCNQMPCVQGIQVQFRTDNGETSMKTKLNQLAALAKRQAKKTATVASVAMMAVASSAHAALPAAVETAITDTGTNLALAATAVIAGLAAFWGLKALGKKLGLWA
jgi:hypothetical protein